MGGGKSSSSADSTNQTTTSSASTTGNTGSVLQGQNITINDQLPQSAVDVFKSLVGFADDALSVAAQAGQKALDSTNSLATATKQPDVALAQGYQKQIYYVIFGAVAIVAVMTIFRKK